MQHARSMRAGETIFGPLVPESNKKSLVWQAGLLMGRISHFVWKQSFTMSDLVELDKTIWLHDVVMLSSPELQHLWKPKNHYLSHLPLDILHWGPPRRWWCEPFEHENQYTKGAVTHSNYGNVLYSAAERKALLCVLESGAFSFEESFLSG